MSTILPGNQESAALALDGGSYGLLARRQSMMEVEPFIEKPDCIRIDVTTTTDNYKFTYGYYIGNRISYIELDGVNMPKMNGPDEYITIPTAGSHVIYIKPSDVWGGNHGFGYFQYCDYLRFPYNLSEFFKCNLNNSMWKTWKKVDILYNGYFGSVKSSSASFGNTTIIRVPVGSKQLYANNGVSSKILDKIVEYNFKYVIPE